MSTLSEKLQAPAEHTAKPVRPSQPVLSVREVRISDQAAGREIVHGVSFDLTPGRTVGIVGESGSGKTLTCRAALGILPAHFEVTGGSIELDGHDITGFSTAEWTSLRGSTISAVFQDPASYLNPSIRVGAQVAEVIRVKKKVRRREARPADDRAAARGAAAGPGAGVRPVHLRAVRRHAPAGAHRRGDRHAARAS